MNSLLVVFLSFFGFIIAYRFYGEIISKRLFKLDAKASTPAHESEDRVDFVPTRPSILFGHHFSSIAGVGPIIGPAIAVIWGWLPALVYILFASVFIGGVHDLGALVLSSRNGGKSIIEISKEVMNPRVRILFFCVTFFALLIVVAIFVMIIAIIFGLYPQTVFPFWLQLPLALIVGWLFYRRGANILPWSLGALAIMYASIYLGILLPIRMPSLLGLSPLTLWVIILLTYAFVASTLPVWRLLQPRDYINSHQLILAMLLLVLGVIVWHPDIAAPLVSAHPAGAPQFIPFLFIIIACGAISGFHSLVASGTTSKQISNEVDARPIAYGGMLLEGFLAVLVILACTAGLGDEEAWSARYISWEAASGLEAKIGAFIDGGASFLTHLGIGKDFALGILGVMVASFAGTTLDTSARIQRYVVSELAQEYRLRPLSTRYGATLFAVLTAGLLSFARGGGKGALLLWPLFGTTNQLLAGLVLLTITVYLLKKGRPLIYTLIPMLFMLIVATWALVLNVKSFLGGGDLFLATLGIVFFLLALWMIGEAIQVYRRSRKGGVAA